MLVIKPLYIPFTNLFLTDFHSTFAIGLHGSAFPSRPVFAEIKNMFKS